MNRIFFFFFFLVFIKKYTRQHTAVRDSHSKISIGGSRVHHFPLNQGLIEHIVDSVITLESYLDSYWTPTYIRSTPTYYIRLLLTYWSSTYISDSYLYITITNTTEFSQHGKLPTAARLVLLSSLYFLFTSFIDLALLHLQSLSLQELHHLHLQTSHLQAPCRAW